jgi:hypothetical protein
MLMYIEAAHSSGLPISLLLEKVFLFLLVSALDRYANVHIALLQNHNALFAVVRCDSESLPSPRRRQRRQRSCRGRNAPLGLLIKFHLAVPVNALLLPGGS